MYTPMPPSQFRRRFRTEGDCLRYVIRRKWPDGFFFPRCGHNRPYLIESRKLYQCAHRGHQTSVTAGLSYQTAWTWCHKIRKAMEDRDTHYTLQGMIELDDTYIGGKKKPGKWGRGARSKVPVMVAVESRLKGCGHVALRKMETFSSQQTKGFLHQNVNDDSIIISDGLYLYRSLGESLNLCQIPLKGGQRAVDIFPDVHRVIARFKMWIRGTHSHVSGKNLDRYLAEFSYRFSRRFKHRRTTIFDRLIKACCTTQPLTYRQLVADLNG